MTLEGDEQILPLSVEDILQQYLLSKIDVTVDSLKEGLDLSDLEKLTRKLESQEERVV